jgi:Spy/CpxP family protein refolding chaperone
MKIHRRSWIACVVAPVALCWGAAALGQESRQIRPEVGLLMQSCSEKLQEAAKELNLTPEQQVKIKDIFESYKGRRKTLREQRLALIKSDLKAIQEYLTPQQREKVDDFIEDKLEALPESDGPLTWLRDDGVRETLAQKLQSAADKLDLTTEQRTKIRERIASSADKYRAQRHARHDLVEAEFKEIADVLTPEQREEARRHIEHRVVTAVMAQSLSHRLHNAADQIGLTADQRKRIHDICENFEPKFEALADARRDLMQAELKAVSNVLTAEQREKVHDFCQDRMVVVRVRFDPKDAENVAQLKETVKDRLEAVADKLGLTDDQRREIKEKCDAFRTKYAPQRNERETLRKAELNAMTNILTPDQREKVKNLINERHNDS